jgi:hypothetical protein
MMRQIVLGSGVVRNGISFPFCAPIIEAVIESTHPKQKIIPNESSQKEAGYVIAIAMP